MGSMLLGSLFVLAFARSENLVLDHNFNQEGLVVVGTNLLDQLIFRTGLICFLDKLLKQCLIILLVLVLQYIHDLRHQIAQDKILHRLEAGIQVIGTDKSLHAVGQDSLLGAAAGIFLTFSDKDKVVYADSFCNLAQGVLAYYKGFDPGIISLCLILEIEIEIFAGDEPQHRVPQEFQLLVVLYVF